LGQEIRKGFVAREGFILMAADYSQIELRVMASISGDPGMIEAFEQGQDIHSTTAAKVFGVKLEDVSIEMRRKSKMVNFGIIYGITAFGLSQRLGIPRKEASGIIQSYLEQYPGVKRYMDDTVSFCEEHGYVETLCGRPRYQLPEQDDSKCRSAECDEFPDPGYGCRHDQDCHDPGAGRARSRGL
jgi:DNA polymerase-1